MKIILKAEDIRLWNCLAASKEQPNEFRKPWNLK